MASSRKPLASDAYQASKKGQSNIRKVVEDIDKLVERSHHLADNSRASYDQVVDLMSTARGLRRRASSALKVVGDLDEAAIDEGQTRTELNATTLQEAAKAVEGVESHARMLIGRFLDEDQRIAALKARLRQKILQELLDIVNAFVDHGTYQKIRRQLLKSGS